MIEKTEQYDQADITRCIELLYMAKTLVRRYKAKKSAESLNKAKWFLEAIKKDVSISIDTQMIYRHLCEILEKQEVKND